VIRHVQRAKLDLVVQTLETLRNRIDERFPDSGLGRVADELLRAGKETGPLLERIRRPNRLLRVGIGTAVVAVAMLTPVVNSVAETNTVASRPPFQRITDPGVNPVPWTCSVKFGSPIVADGGTSAVTVGATMPDHVRMSAVGHS